MKLRNLLQGTLALALTLGLAQTASAQLTPGSKVQLGTYNGTPITWTVVYDNGDNDYKYAADSYTLLADTHIGNTCYMYSASSEEPRTYEDTNYNNPAKGTCPMGLMFYMGQKSTELFSTNDLAAIVPSSAAELPDVLYAPYAESDVNVINTKFDNQILFPPIVADLMLRDTLVDGATWWPLIGTNAYSDILTRTISMSKTDGSAWGRTFVRDNGGGYYDIYSDWGTLHNTDNRCGDFAADGYCYGPYGEQTYAVPMVSISKTANFEPCQDNDAVYCVVPKTNDLYVFSPVDDSVAATYRDGQPSNNWFAYVTYNSDDDDNLIELYAGKNLLVGKATLTPDNGRLIMTVEMEDGYSITKIHYGASTNLAAIAKVNKKGKINIAPGQLPGKASYPVPDFGVELPQSWLVDTGTYDLGAYTPGTDIFVIPNLEIVSYEKVTE